MSVSILEALMNAKINLIDNGNTVFGNVLGKAQLKNAVTLLEKGYGLEDEVEPLIDQYGDVDNVPDKN